MTQILVLGFELFLARNGKTRSHEVKSPLTRKKHGNIARPGSPSTVLDFVRHITGYIKFTSSLDRFYE